MESDQRRIGRFGCSSDDAELQRFGPVDLAEYAAYEERLKWEIQNQRGDHGTDLIIDSSIRNGTVQSRV